ncbi:hypothetical protein F4604DRAFT_1748925 [Suillus subluteus]|nr:hypothetical protein F4604DRAFT_1748925 [Suillus subluteus]
MSRTIPNHNFTVSADDGRTIDMGETWFFSRAYASISLTGVHQLNTDTLLRLGCRIQVLLMRHSDFLDPRTGHAPGTFRLCRVSTRHTGVIDGKGSGSKPREVPIGEERDPFPECTRLCMFRLKTKPLQNFQFGNPYTSNVDRSSYHDLPDVDDTTFRAMISRVNPLQPSYRTDLELLCDAFVLRRAVTRSSDSNRPHAIGPYSATARIDSTHESTYHPPT